MSVKGLSERSNCCRLFFRLTEGSWLHRKFWLWLVLSTKFKRRILNPLYMLFYVHGLRIIFFLFRTCSTGARNFLYFWYGISYNTKILLLISLSGRVYQFFTHLLYTIAKENGEGSGEFTFAAVVEKIMPQTGMKGIVVNNRITNVFRKKDWVHVC